MATPAKPESSAFPASPSIVAASPATTTSSSRKVELSPYALHMELVSSDLHCPLTIINPTNQPLGFKVKTTTPSRYFVKPNQGLIAARGSAVVGITMKKKEAQHLLDLYQKSSLAASDPQANPAQLIDNDKFLITTVPVDESFAWEPNSPAKDEIFQKMWESKDKAVQANRRITCSFVYPTPENQAAAPVAQNATPQAVKASRAEPVATTPAAAVKSSAVKPAANPAPVAASPAPAQAAPVTHATTLPPSGGSTDEKLSQKYKDVVAYAMKLTEERDRYMNRLNDINKELTVRNSKGHVLADRETVQVTGYQLWHLILVAIVTFLLARFFINKDVVIGQQQLTEALKNLLGGASGS